MSDLIQFNTLGDNIRPDITTYYLDGEECSVLVDPGPYGHVHRYRRALSQRMVPGKPLVVLVLSPFPGCLSGLRLLQDVAEKRILYLHWTVAASRETSLQAWKVRMCTTPEHTVRIGPADRISLRRPDHGQLPGTLVGYHPRTRTLFTGPLFGSMGVGKRTGIPVLRRESVRIYTDVMTAEITAGTVLDSFDSIADFGQLAPAHGKLATGGRKLVDTVFQLDRVACTPVSALYRLYLRVAGLLGQETASGLYQAARVPEPDLETGYAAGMTDDVVSTVWPGLVSSLTQWIGGAELDVLQHTLVMLSVRATLPLPESFSGAMRAYGAHVSRAARPVESLETGQGVAQSDVAYDSQALAADLKRIRESKVECALLLVSLDRIEQINRRLGRVGGDDALNALSYLLQNYRLSRSDGVLTRLYKLTGPNFVYVIENSEDQDMPAVAEEIRKTVAESALFLERITVSIGLVQSHELQEDGSSSELLDRAQGRLALARASGMNTICSSDPEESAIGSGGATVLIADPAAPYLHTLTRILEDKGYSVLMADDGDDALETISQIRPDAIVCEAFLPKLNGFGLREQLRSSSEMSSIPFILVSHRKDEETIEKAALLGITFYLRKPFLLVELVGLLSNLTRSRA